MAFAGYLKQSTAADILIGPFIDDTDGKSAETGLTLDVEVSKNGQALANKSDATAPVHDAAGTVDGYYNCELDATDTGTLGILTVVAHAAGFLPVRLDYQIVTANWYDSMCSTENLDVNVVEIDDDTTAADNAEAFFDGTGYAGTNNVIPTVSTLTGHTAQTGDSFARIGAAGAGLTAVPWNAAWDAEVESEVTDSLEAHNLDHLALTATVAADMTAEVADNTILSRMLANGDTSAFVPSTDGLQLIRDKLTDIETDTGEIGAAGAGLTAVPWNASWDAEVQSEVQDAIEVNKLDHLVAVADADDAVNDSIVAKLAASDGDWSGFDNAADSLEAIRDRGDAAWTTGAGTGLTALASGTAQGGAASTIQLAAGETFSDNELNGNIVKVTSGTGAGQARVITAYTGATDTATVYPNWTTNPDATSVYEVVEGSVNLAAISLDGAAADNLELDYDGTGYAKTNSTIGTTTTNSDMRGTDSAALASVCTEARLAELDAGNIPTDLTNIAAAVDLNTLIISPVGGTTDGDGNVGGTTVLDSTRSEATNHWNNLAIEITSGTCIGQLRPIELFTTGVGFTVPSSRPFTAQIVTGVTYRIVSAVIAQPGITVSKNAQTVVEPDGLVNIGLTIITANGAPPVGDITPGTISIYRIRAGASTLIVNAAACSEAEGNVFYSYTFPSASWQAGDSYLAVTVGQSVVVNGTDYPLSTTAMQGYVTREIAILADTDELQTDDIPTLIADLPTVAEFEARTIPTADYFDPVNDAVANVTLVATTTTNSGMRGTDGANTTVPDAAGTAAALHVTTDAAIAALNDPTAAAVADAVWDELATGHTDAGKAGQQLWTDVDAILVDTAVIGAAGAGLTEAGGTGDHLTAVPWNASWDAEVQSEVDDALDTTLADSIPADGTIPTLRQAIYMITQFLMERAVSDTTVTVKKVDGSTSLLTLTLDDASDPTSITRAT
jgi:hypothetical protein